MPVADLTQDEQDFDAAFEAAQKTPSDKPTSEKPEVETPQGDADEGAQQPEEGGGDEAQPEGKAGGAEPTLEQKLADALRERDEALHKWRSDANRQSAITLKNNQLTAQVSRLTDEVARLKAQLSEQTKKPAAAAEGGDDASDVLENAPELKAAVERRIQAALEGGTRELREKLDAATSKLAEVGQQADHAAQRIEPLASREEQRQIEDVRGQLDKAFPKWRADVASGELQRWVETQPEQIKAMFPGKGYADSSAVLKLFYADKGAPNQGAGNERLRNAAGIAPRNVARPNVNKEDFDGAFEEFSARKRR